MKIEKKQKENVRKELVKAYSYFGMDEYDMEDKIEEQMNIFEYTFDNIVRIDGVEYLGKLLQIVYYKGKTQETIYKEIICKHLKPNILYLFVNNEILEYVLYEYDLYLDINDKFLNVENNKYSLVKLEKMALEDASLE